MAGKYFINGADINDILGTPYTALANKNTSVITSSYGNLPNKQASTFTHFEKYVNDIGFKVNGTDLKEYVSPIYHDITTTNTNYTIPSWANYANIICIGGGGGGAGGNPADVWKLAGFSTSNVPSGGGGSGGGGGYNVYKRLNVSNKDTLNIQIGAGGSRGIAYTPGSSDTYNNGGIGGSTIVIYNGIEIVEALGGDGGKMSWDTNSNNLTAVVLFGSPGGSVRNFNANDATVVSTTPTSSIIPTFTPAGKKGNDAKGDPISEGTGVGGSANHLWQGQAQANIPKIGTVNTGLGGSSGTGYGARQNGFIGSPGMVRIYWFAN
jgi:hypothetical protein